MLERKSLKNHALALSLFALFMLGMSFAAVPLYKLFCQVTGYGGTPLISKEKNLIQIGEQIDIRFDSSVEKNSPLYFEPERKIVSVNIGENSLAFYKAVNKTDREITTMSVFNVTPHQAAKEISEKITEIIENNEAELSATNGKLKEVREELKEEQISNAVDTVAPNSSTDAKKSNYALRLALLGIASVGMAYYVWSSLL